MEKTKQQLFEQLSALWETFAMSHASTKFKDSKEARKSLSSIKKLVSEYNKVSVSEDNAAKEAKKQASV